MANSKTANSDLDVIKQVDFTKGFTSWHVKWSRKNDLEDQNSAEFQTGPSYRWRLRVYKDVGRNFWLTIQATKLVGTLVSGFRFAIQVSDQRPLTNVSGVHVVVQKPYGGYGIRIPVDQAQSFKGADLVMHCWIDIPNCLDGNPEINGPPNEASIMVPGLLASALSDCPNPTAYDDVTLVLIGKDGKPLRRFHCHRCILAARSDVFACMFADGNWKEGTKGEIEIKDIDTEAMQIVLTYIYTSRMPQDKCTINAGILYAATKYNISALVRWCEIDLITHHANDTNRIDQLKLADMYGLRQLKAVCLATLVTNVGLCSDPGSSPLDDDLLHEVIMEAARRQLVTKQITVADEYS